MSKAWLAPLLGDTALPAAAFQGNPKEAVWLPNEAVAKAWMEYVKTGAVSDTTPPPAPTNVQRVGQGRTGREITWDAEADFESGIRGFIVLRDGQGTGEGAADAGRQIRPAVVPEHDVSRHAGAAAAGDALPGRLGQGRCQAHLRRHHREQRGAEVGAGRRVTPAKRERGPLTIILTGRSRGRCWRTTCPAISMEGLLNGRGDLDDNIRMLKNTGAKFIGRSLCLWGGEANLLRNLERAKQQIPKVHAADPEMILQACIFEIVTTQVEQVPVPDWAFVALGRPVEKRNFRYADMLYPDGRRKDQWGRDASVPDVSRPETKLWFYFLAASYIDLGIEAIHFGQAEMMNGNDRDLAHYSRGARPGPGLRGQARPPAHGAVRRPRPQRRPGARRASCSWTSTRSRCGSRRSPTSRRRRS